MLPSKYRLKKKVNFARVEIDGRIIQSKSFGIQIYNRNDDSNTCFGFIISTKISKKAVIRNRIKRIIADSIRNKLSSLERGFDVVFLLKPSILNLEREEIEKEVVEILFKYLQK